MTSAYSKTSIITLTLLTLALMGVLGFGIYTIQMGNVEIKKMLNLAEEAAQKKALVQSVNNLQNTSREEIEAFEAIVLSDEDLVPLIESIEDAGMALGLETEIVSVDKPLTKKKDDEQRIKMVIESKGSWRGNFLIIQALENLPHRAIFEKVLLSKEGEAWRSQVTLSLFSFD